jgi:hypothetical protein
MRRLLTTLSLLVVALAATATGAVAGGGGLAGGGGHAICRGFADGAEVELDDNCLDGIGHVAPFGTTLTVHNRGQFPHTYTAVDGSFDTGTLQPGESAEVTDLAPGVWPVRCTLHSSVDGEGMTGLLVVTDDADLELAAANPDATSSDSSLGWWLLAVVASTGVGALLARHLIRPTP